ncbi:MAG: hypothetical protein J6Z80_02045 [Clostridia bacterium]|nr:hypothetical protein [Clostridia bacterium]
MIPENLLLGNERLREYILSLSEKRRFPGSMIIAGPEGSGRHTAGRIIAMSLCCTDKSDRPCFRCLFCRKILEGISPDVIFVGPKKGVRSIGVDDVRQLRTDAFVAPTECDAKVYILENAERMTASAQNAMLKIFEEPPEGVYFILLCDSASSLLPTIRSRAPELNTEVFGDEALTAHLRTVSPGFSEIEKNDPAAAAAIVRQSGGTIGRALGLISGKGAERNENISLVVRALSEKKPADLLVSLKAACGSGRDETADALRALMNALRDVAASKRGGKEVGTLFYPDADEARSDGSRMTVRSALRYYERVLGTVLLIDWGAVNVSTSLTSLVADLRALMS